MNLLKRIQLLWFQQKAWPSRLCCHMLWWVMNSFISLLLPWNLFLLCHFFHLPFLCLLAWLSIHQLWWNPIMNFKAFPSPIIITCCFWRLHGQCNYENCRKSNFTRTMCKRVDCAPGEVSECTFSAMSEFVNPLEAVALSGHAPYLLLNLTPRNDPHQQNVVWDWAVSVKGNNLTHSTSNAPWNHTNTTNCVTIMSSDRN